MISSFSGVFFKLQNPDYSRISDLLNSSQAITKYKTIWKFPSFHLFSDLNKNESDTGSHPGFIENENYLIIFNGLIHNLSALEGTFNNDSSIKNLDYSFINGEYSLLVYSKRSNAISLVRDPMGSRPLYYLDNEHFFGFSTDLHFPKALIQEIIQTDEVWIADTLCGNQSEKWRTFYKGISRVEPGHELIYKGVTLKRKYWSPEADADIAGIEYTYALKELKFRLENAIRQSIINCNSAGAELSGGLDSSAIAAIGKDVADESGIDFHTFTHAFSDYSRGKYFPGKDESGYASLVADHAGIRNHEITHPDGKGIIEPIKESIIRHSGLTQQHYSMLSDILYDKAKERGVELLFSGFGGDEGVSSGANHILQELLLNKDWKTYRNEYYALRKRKGGIKPRHILKCNLMRFVLFRKYFIRRRPMWAHKRYNNITPSKEFSKQVNLKKRHFSRFQKQSQESLLEYQYRRIMHEHVSQRLEYSHIDAKAKGIEYVHPLLDFGLLRFYYSLPARFKLSSGTERAVFRDALKGIIPENIRMRTDKSIAAVPTVHQRIIFDYHNIQDLIDRSQANSYHYVDYEKLRELIARLKSPDLSADKPLNQSHIINCIKILLLQEMERTGEFKSGIRC